MKKRQSTRNHWENFWGTHTLLPIEKTIEELASLVELNGRSVVEIGAGSGTTSLALAQLGAHVTCVDYADNALSLIRSAAAGVRAGLVKGDALRLPFADNSFDLCFHQGLLEHFGDPLPLLTENFRILRSGGYCLIDVPQRYSLYTLKKHIKMAAGTWFAGWETEFSSPELRRVVAGAGFVPVKGYGRFHGRHIDRIQRRLLGREVVPRFMERTYYAAVKRLEDSPIGRATAFSIGLIARKP